PELRTAFTHPYLALPPSDSSFLSNLEGTYPKPLISVTPQGRVIPLGRNATIRCTCGNLALKFELIKEPNGATERGKLVEFNGYSAEFLIPQISHSDGGSYTCRYYIKSSAWSPISVPVQIIVEDPSYPTPFIRIRNYGGVIERLTVGIECEGPEPGLIFSLHKAEGTAAVSTSEKPGKQAGFDVSVKTLDEAKSYTCRYHRRWKPFVWSPPSNPVEVPGDEKLPKPSISAIRPGPIPLGENTTFLCRASVPNSTFRLDKDGDAHGPLHEAGDNGYQAEFHIANVSRQDGGSYTCRYHPRGDMAFMSKHSDPTELLVSDPSYPRPVIAVTPRGGSVRGLDVTLRCQAPEPRLIFSLHRVGATTALRRAQQGGDSAEFHFPAVSWGDAGNYTCRYHRMGQYFVCSEPSDPAALVVRATLSVGISIRMGVAGAVLLLMMLIVAEAVCSWQRGRL
uniref:Ig-like domain-containing protein n=1 Tax=Sphenodon punctatus TaxID=8508 RepID=A0A8D0LAB7_SPHPU